MKPLLFALWVVFAFGGLSAQQTAWQPSPGHTQEPIWPGAVPDAQPVAGSEVAKTTGKEFQVAGRPVVGVSNVSQPTMTVYSPPGKNTGAAVVVFPGGGYLDLAIDLEGTEVCDWLTSKGITCVLLKYRVPGEHGYPKPASYPKSGPYPESPMALEDAQRTLGLVRLRAAEWHIDPHKIGVLGFSSGGHLVAAMSTHFAKRLYPSVDAADKESCRPDFAVAVYPGHLSLSAAEWDAKQGTKKYVIHYPATADKDLGLNPDIPVTHQTPPTFLLQAEDDHVDNVNDSLAYYIALKNAGVPVEMHLYAEGGHAFGLRRTKSHITGWPQLVETWLGTIGMISEGSHVKAGELNQAGGVSITMKRVTGIGGIFFKANDQAKLLEWYEKHLGIKADPKYGTAFEWRDKDDPQTVGMTAWSMFKDESKYFDRPFMVNYRVDDLDALLEALKAEGVEIDPKRENHEYGKFAWIIDPEGNRIELWEPPKGNSK